MSSARPISAERGPALKADHFTAGRSQDQNGAVPVLHLSRRNLSFIAKALADAGYAAKKPAAGQSLNSIEAAATCSRFIAPGPADCTLFRGTI